MNYQIKTPYCILPDGYYSIPKAGSISEDDRLFIITNEENVCEALIESLNNQLEKRRKISPSLFNDILDDALTSVGQLNKQCDLAFLLMHPGGCLVAQMGRSRVIHISAHNHEIAYDSRNQIQDYSTKARAELLSDVNDGDTIIITLADRIDSHKLTHIAADHGASDELNIHLRKALSVNRDDAPASFIIHLQQVKGSFVKIPDVNWKWILLYLFLALLIAVMAVVTLTGNLRLPKSMDDSPATVSEMDSITNDTILADTLLPAIDTQSIEVVETPTPQQDDSDSTLLTEKHTVAELPTAEPISQNPSDNPTATSPTVAKEEPTTTAPQVTPDTPHEPEP